MGFRPHVRFLAESAAGTLTGTRYAVDTEHGSIHLRYIARDARGGVPLTGESKNDGHNPETDARKGQSFELLHRNTANATLVSGRGQLNVAPSTARMELDGRLLPGYAPEDLMAELRIVVGGEVELEVFRYDLGAPQLDMALLETLKGILRSSDPDGEPISGRLPRDTDARFSR